MTRSMLATILSHLGRHQEALSEQSGICFADRVKPTQRRSWPGSSKHPGSRVFSAWYLGQHRSTLAKRKNSASTFNLALLHARLGEREEALAWLEEARKNRVGLLVYIKVHPWLQTLRNEERFAAVVERMGLPT